MKMLEFILKMDASDAETMPMKSKYCLTRLKLCKTNSLIESII